MYLSVMAAALDLWQEAEFTPGQPTVVFPSHSVLLLLELKGGYWLTSDHLRGYQFYLIILM